MKPKYANSKLRILTSGSTLVTAITICFASSAFAVDNHWTGASSTDWNTATNWDLGRVPANPNGAPTGDTFDDAVINLTSPVATISTSLSVNPRDIIVGDGAGNSGKLNHVAGTAQAGGWLYVGRGGATGVYNLADVSGTGGAFTNFAIGSGSVSGGRLFVGGFNGTGSNGTLNVNTTGSLTVGSELNIGTNNSTGVVNVDNGTVTVNNNWLRVGSNGSAGTLNISGGSVTKNGGDHLILADNGGTGTVNMNAGTLTVNGECWIGQAGGTGILNLTGGTINSNNWAAVARDNNASHGTVNHSGGTWNKTGGGNFIIGDNGQGIYNLSGTGVLNANGEFWVGSGGGSHGDLNITGGTLITNNWIAIGRGGGVGNVNMSGGTWNKVNGNQFIVGSSGPGTMNMTGGLVDVQGGFTWVGEGSGATTATLTISGTAEWRTSTMSVGQSTPNAILNLDGGTVKTTRFNGTRNEDDTGDSGGTGTINFNGTQIIASNNNTTNFISTTVDNAVIAPGGLLVNSNTYKLVAPKALSGTGGVVKSGLGSLTLSGANSYSGTNTVNAGKLILSGDSTGTGAITVANGAGFGLIQTTDTDSFDTSGATFGSASGATSLDLTVGAPTVAALNVTGTLTLNGPVTVNISGTFTAATTIPLVHYTGSKAGSGSFVLGTLPPGLIANLVDNGTGLLSLNVTALKHWDGALNSGKWDIGTTANWFNEFTSTSATYVDQTSAYFNDLATNSDVVLNVTVAPRSVYFSNEFLVYTLGGTGKITGTTGLTKSGVSSLAISTTNDYTGVTRLEGGTTTVGTLTNGGVASALGAASSAPANLVLAGGILNYTGGAVTTDRGLSVAAIDNNAVSGLGIGANNVTLSGQISASLGKLVKTGTGTLILSGTGANVLAVGSDGDAVAPAFSLAEGGLLFNGTGQTDSVIGRTAFGTTTSVTTTAEFASNVSFTGNGRTFVAFADTSTSTLTVGGTSQLQLNDAFLVAQGNGSTGNVIIKDTGKITKTGGYFSLGIGTSSTATMTISNSGKFVSDGDFNVGDVNGSIATLNALDSAAITSSGGVLIGKNNTTGVLNMSGTSTVSSGDTNVGGNDTSHGTLDIKGTSVYTSGGRLQVGPGGGSTGTVIIENSGSMIVNSYVSVGFGGSGSMTVKNNGTFTNIDDFSVNESGDQPAVVNLQDSAVMSVGRTLFIGRNTGKVGTLTVSGASTLNQTGTGYSLIVGPAGTGTLNIQGTATVNALGTAGVVVTNNATGTGVVNLDGGKLVTTKVSSTGGVGSNSTFNFNGGVLKAGTGAALDFMNGLTTVNVGTGGAFIDTNGQTIAIGQVLSDQDGNLTKQGAGTLLLNGANSYLGTTTVAAGTLGGTGSLSGPLVVAATSSIAPGASNIGTFTTDSTTIGGTYVCEVSGATGDVLASNGQLTISPGAKLDFDALAAPTGAATVIATYGTLSGTFTTVLDLPSGYTLDYHYLGNQIAIVASGASPYDTWAGTFGLNPATDGAPGADKDVDGQKNLVEFALGGSPISGSNNAKVFSLIADSSADVDTTAESLLTIAVRAGTPAFTGSPSPTATYDGVTYIIEGSTTLSSFPVAVTPVTLVAPPAPNAAPPAGYEYRTFSLSGSNGLGNKGFLRVKVIK